MNLISAALAPVKAQRHLLFSCCEWIHSCWVNFFFGKGLNMYVSFWDMGSPSQLMDAIRRTGFGSVLSTSVWRGKHNTLSTARCFLVSSGERRLSFLWIRCLPKHCLGVPQTTWIISVCPSANRDCSWECFPDSRHQSSCCQLLLMLVSSVSALARSCLEREEEVRQRWFGSFMFQSWKYPEWLQAGVCEERVTFYWCPEIFWGFCYTSLGECISSCLLLTSFSTDRTMYLTQYQDWYDSYWDNIIIFLNEEADSA